MTPIHRQKLERTGAVLAAAIIALVTASIILFGILHAAVNSHRQLLVDRFRLQAEALAQAGIDRAVSQLARSPSYQGETWQLSAADLGDTSPGEVQIKITPAEDAPGAVQITAEAAYPSDAEQRAQKTRTRIVERK